MIVSKAIEMTKVTGLARHRRGVQNALDVLATLWCTTLHRH